MATEVTSEDIATASLKPSEMTADGVTVKKRPLKELIEAANHVAGMSAVASAGSAWGCLRPARVVPPGAVGPTCD